MIYKIKVYDNFHYMDETKAWTIAENYETFDAALAKAKKMVEEDIENYYKEGMTLNDIIGAYSLSGNDPVIYTEPAGGGRFFSTRNYAEEYAVKFLKSKEPKKNRDTVFQLKVSKNRYYDDDGILEIRRNYFSYEEVLDAAKKILEADVNKAYKTGISLNEILQWWCNNGNTPGIITIGDGDFEEFRPYKYLKEYATDFLKFKERAITRDKDLNSLYQLCRQGKTSGSCSNYHFSYLRKRYSWHYLNWTRQFLTPFYKDEIINYLKEQLAIFQDFCMDAPVDEGTKLLINCFISECDDAIKLESNQGKVNT